MSYTEEQIIKIFKEAKIENPVFFTYLLPSFIWSKTKKKVEDYSTSPTNDNEVVIHETDLYQIKKGLLTFFSKLEVNSKDVFIICLNPDYLPKTKGEWLRMRILKNII